MTEQDDLKKALEQSRQKFLAAIAMHRPKLHRYCSRMTGSVFDGEDLVQETLAQAYYRLSQLKQDRPLEPWLFRIAHNKCIDFLRRRKAFVDLGEDLDAIAGEDTPTINSEEVKEAVELVVKQLPAMERACFVLKDVLDYSLAEIADIVGTTTGAVKSALHRGREKLQKMSPANDKAELPPDKERLISLYVDRFNRRDWAGLRELIRQDAHLEVVGTAELVGREQITTGYFGNYKRLEIPWKFTAGRVDGEDVLICWRYIDGCWSARTAIKIAIEDGQVVAIKDYIYADYLLQDAQIVSPNPNK